VTGIALSNQKRQLLCSRLGKRLRHHGLENFSQYYEYLCNKDANQEELRHMVNAMTTNKTEFFREAHHFDFLRSSVVPALMARSREGGPRKIRIWSAGCSSGEEPYSIAMLLDDCLPALGAWDVKILASDIDTNMLAHAEAAVYSEADIAKVPAAMRRASFERFEDGPEYRVRRELRELIKFRQINLIDKVWPIRTHFDVLFCRNVTIYFDRATQKLLYSHFTRYLAPGGYLVAGHSENLSWLSSLFRPVGNTIYQMTTVPAARRSVSPRVRSLRPVAASPGPSRSKAPSVRAERMATPQSERAGELAVEDGVLRARIQSGEVYASAAPCLVSTVLGSCVATCLYDLEVAIGGMNHFMLPESGENSALPACYGVHAMELLIDRLLALGARRERLQAKLFGAAHVLSGSEQGRRVADSNAAFAKEYLLREGIATLAERLGGKSPLQVNFFTHTGKVLLRTIRSQQQAVADVELRYQSELEQRVSAPPPPVILF
jgi:chemotaxis protein methyltransferase CheR